ncbi:hypothetical protein Btru_043584 [Bulinus truncatus]|nr:hypothetical protein Btru_043584 [Bulinus truncatus]
MGVKFQRKEDGQQSPLVNNLNIILMKTSRDDRVHPGGEGRREDSPIRIEISQSLIKDLNSEKFDWQTKIKAIAFQPKRRDVITEDRSLMSLFECFRRCLKANVKSNKDIITENIPLMTWCTCRKSGCLATHFCPRCIRTKMVANVDKIQSYVCPHPSLISISLNFSCLFSFAFLVPLVINYYIPVRSTLCEKYEILELKCPINIYDKNMRFLRSIIILHAIGCFGMTGLMTCKKYRSKRQNESNSVESEDIERGSPRTEERHQNACLANLARLVWPLSIYITIFYSLVFGIGIHFVVYFLVRFITTSAIHASIDDVIMFLVVPVVILFKDHVLKVLNRYDYIVESVVRLQKDAKFKFSRTNRTYHEAVTFSLGDTSKALTETFTVKNQKLRLKLSHPLMFIQTNGTFLISKKFVLQPFFNTHYHILWQVIKALGLTLLILVGTGFFVHVFVAYNSVYSYTRDFAMATGFGTTIITFYLVRLRNINPTDSKTDYSIEQDLTDIFDEFSEEWTISELILEDATEQSLLLEKILVMYPATDLRGQDNDNPSAPRSRTHRTASSQKESNDATAEATTTEATATESTTTEATNEATTEAKNEATPTEATNEATTTEAKNEATPTEATNDATTTEAKNEATPTEATNEATTTEAKNEATPTEATNEAKTTEATNEATPTEATNEATTTEATNEATPTEATNEATTTEATTTEAIPTEATNEDTTTEATNEATTAEATTTEATDEATITEATTAEVSNEATITKATQPAATIEATTAEATTTDATNEDTTAKATNEATDEATITEATTAEASNEATITEATPTAATIEATTTKATNEATITEATNEDTTAEATNEATTSQLTTTQHTTSQPTTPQNATY